MPNHWFIPVHDADEPRCAGSSESFITVYGITKTHTLDGDEAGALIPLWFSTLWSDYKEIADFSITTYYDTDWDGDTVNRKSRTGFLVYIGGSLVSWVSRKHSTFSRSSIEAEYMAVVTATQEHEAVHLMLQELGVEVPKLMIILTKNIEIVFIAWNPVSHIELKHVPLNLHFIWEKTKERGPNCQAHCRDGPVG